MEWSGRAPAPPANEAPTTQTLHNDFSSPTRTSAHFPISTTRSPHFTWILAPPSGQLDRLLHSDFCLQGSDFSRSRRRLDPATPC
jgi:hypothetical protein